MEDHPQPSERVRELVLEGKRIAAINRYQKETKVRQREATRVIDALIAGELGPLVTQRDPVIVHRRSGSRGGMATWLAADIERMAREGYVEISHHEEGTARGCLAFFAPPSSEVVVTYRRVDAGDAGE